MEVDFDQLGPGQVGRLVYQVIGSNGPVSNPARIRYLAPGQAPDVSDSSMSGLAGASVWAGAAQAVDLGLGLANLGVSAAILAEVNALGHKVDQLALGVASLDRKVDQILERVERIDVNVAENNLRSALRHVLGTAFRDGEVDLARLRTLDGDIDKFCEALEGFGLGLCPGLRFSSDVREMVVLVTRLLWAPRVLMWQRFNQVADGDPNAVLNDDLYSGRFDVLAEMVSANISVRRTLKDLPEALGDKVYSEFMWADDGTRKRFESWVKEEVRQAFDGALFDEDPEANLLADLLEKKLAKKKATAPQVVEYLEAWAAHTDAALLWRLMRELSIANNEALWDFLEGATRDEIDVSPILSSASPAITGVVDMADVRRELEEAS